jgi:carboxylesterase type B
MGDNTVFKGVPYEKPPIRELRWNLKRAVYFMKRRK